MQPTRRRNTRLAGRTGKVLLRAVLTAAGIVAAAMPAAAQSVELAWQLEAGTDLVYRVSVQSETELPQGMGSSTMNMDTTQRWSVLEVDGNGNATIRLATDRVRMSIGGPMGTMSVDSSDPAGSGSPLDAVAALAGTSHSVVIDSRGTLLEMSGIEALQETLRAQMPDPSAQAMLDQILNEETLRGQWEQGMVTLPAEAVGVGSTWERTLTMPLPPAGTAAVTTSNEVASIEGDLVVIGSSGTLSVADDGSAPSPIPVNIGDATMTGTSRFDNGRGLLLDTEATIALQMTMSMGGQGIALDVVTTVTMELVEE